MKHFPNATIIKPSSIYGQHDNFIRLWLIQKMYLSNFNLVFDDCKARKQPIFVNDVALAVLNALKMPETVGKIYELGGPHVYTMLEIYETVYNILEREPKIAYFNRDIALAVAEKILNWRHFNKDMILKHSDTMVCSEGSN